MIIAQSNKERDALRWQIVSEWRSDGRFDYSEAELNTEIDRRLNERSVKRLNSKQLALPLFDAGLVSAETRREACKASRQTRINRRFKIRELLDAAGPQGMTREAIAKAIGCKEGGVSQPVKQLIDSGEACEPFATKSSLGFDVAVVVLVHHARGQVTGGAA